MHDEEDKDKGEYLYEEEVELTWEKGGSGLVIHTDAAYWDQEKGDYHERTTDDWDITDAVPSSAFGSRRKPLVRRKRKQASDQTTKPSDFGYHSSVDKAAIEAPPIEPFGKGDVGGFEKYFS